jgi:phosphoribosyl 1,2-cyclic phosphodiesterase
MPDLSFDLTFLGTGVSHSIPKLDHALRPSDCAVCADAVAGGLLSKNRRNNISACIRFFHHSPHSEGQPSPHAAVIIDVGKTFRDSILSRFGGLNVQQVDSVLISHKHADAIGGLDDLRDMQHMQVDVDAASGLSIFSRGRPLNLIADADCLWGANGISTRFAYLNPPSINAAPHPCHVPSCTQCAACKKSPVVDAADNAFPMFKPVASVTWWCAQHFQPFFMHGISVMVVLRLAHAASAHTPYYCVQAIPLLHGRCDGQLCTGFVFNGGSLVWLSDVVELPEGTFTFIFLVLFSGFRISNIF